MAAPEKNAQHIYNDVAENWWSDDIRWVRILKNMVPARLRWFDRAIDWQDKEVLDLGCAGGFMAEAMDDRGARVTGIDPAADAIEAARAHAAMTHRHIEYHVGKGEALPYESASFDAVVCVDVLEHVDDLDRVVKEVARVLRPGGVFLFDTINRNPVATFVTITVAENLLGILPKGTHDPKLFIKPGELARHLKDAGLVPGDTAGLGPRGVNARGDFTFGRIPGNLVIFMGTAAKPSNSTP